MAAFYRTGELSHCQVLLAKKSWRAYDRPSAPGRVRIQPASMPAADSPPQPQQRFDNDKSSPARFFKANSARLAAVTHWRPRACGENLRQTPDSG